MATLEKSQRETDAQANVDRLAQELAVAKGELQDAKLSPRETVEEANERFLAETRARADKTKRDYGSTTRASLRGADVYEPAKTPAKEAAEAGTFIKPKATIKPGKAKK